MSGMYCGGHGDPLPCGTCSRNWEKGQRKRRRRLIAAAPDLLDALIQLADVIDAAGVFNLSRGVQLGPTVWSVKCSDAMASARAALAKATGADHV